MHTHNHHAHHHHGPQQYNLAFALAVGLNLLFVIIEIIYALHANSMSLLADAGHNLGDVIGLAFAWVANVMMKRAANERYSYGHRKLSVLAAVFNAVLLIVTSVLIAREAVDSILAPGPVKENIVIIVAMIGIAINGGTALLFMRGRNDDINIKGAFLHLAADTLISLGVVITGLLILYSDWHILDPIVGLIIVAMIVISTWALLRNSINMIIDAVPYNVDIHKVRNYLCNLPGVNDIHDLHIWALSTQENALTVHLVMPERPLSDKQYQDINLNLLQLNIHHVTIQVERGDNENLCIQEKSCCY